MSTVLGREAGQPGVGVQIDIWTDEMIINCDVPAEFPERALSELEFGWFARTFLYNAGYLLRQDPPHRGIVMLSFPVKLSLAVRRLDAELEKRAREYPEVLPIGHLSLLKGWEPRLKWVGGVLMRYTVEEFSRLGPLERQLEVNRAHAEALLALCRAGELIISEDEEEWLVQRALGIIPSNEDQRFAEIVSCPELEPNFMVSRAERYARGIAMVEEALGSATALAYGSMLMAGLRGTADLVRYGIRLQQLFDSLIRHPSVLSRLEGLTNGMQELDNEDRMQVLAAVRDQLWRGREDKTGRFLTLTQVIDGYLGLQQTGLGDGVSLALLDSIIVGKLSFRVRHLLWQGRVCLEIAISAQAREYWDPLDPTARVVPARAARAGVIDVLACGYLRMAQGYANVRSFQNGARVAHWVLDLRPETADAYGVLAQCSLGMDQPRQAIEQCRRALELNPNLVDVHLILGNAYAVMRRWHEAVDSYKRAVAVRPGNAEAFNNLGLALVQSGEQERAIGAYREAVRIRPGYAEAYYNLGNLYLELKEYEKAVGAYRQAVGASPGFAGAYYNLGQAYYLMGELRSALEAYQAAVKANPKHAGAWHNMGIVYRDLGEKERAVEAIEKAVELNPALLR